MEFSADFLKAVRERFNKYLLFAEFIGLLATALATVVAMGHEIKTMFWSWNPTLTDLLLMFLYLEVLAMVGMYFKVGQLPVKFPVYIAMVALARELILGNGTASGTQMLQTAGAVLMLALAVLIIRMGQVKYPTQDDGKFEK